MTTEIIIEKDLWEEEQEGVITSWLADNGATIEKGTLIAEVMTDKVQFEINAPTTGKLTIKHDVDAVVNKGDIIGIIE